MTIFQAIILGAVQGVTELLPISSSAHLLLVPQFLGWPSLGLSFDAALHLGTFLAIFLFFRKDLLSYLTGFLRSLARRRIETREEKMAFLLLAGSIPAALLGLLLEDLAASVFRLPAVTVIALVLGALFLWGADRYGKTTKKVSDVGLKEGVFVGLSQAIALVPGFSRSGMSIGFGRLFGLDREAAARFSFLLAAPISLGAALFEYPKVVAAGFSLNIIAGVLSAALFGYLAIKFLLQYLNKNNYNAFVYYRLVLAAVVLGMLV